MVKNNQQIAALIVGYILVAGLFFGLGKYYSKTRPPEIRVEEPALDLSQVYDKLKLESKQEAVAGVETQDSNCEGKIKGNVSSSGKIYHLPGGSFYNRTIAEICFDTEADALKAGFRKSSR